MSLKFWQNKLEKLVAVKFWESFFSQKYLSLATLQKRVGHAHKYQTARKKQAGPNTRAYFDTEWRRSKKFNNIVTRSFGVSDSSSVRTCLITDSGHSRLLSKLVMPCNKGTERIRHLSKNILNCHRCPIFGSVEKSNLNIDCKRNVSPDKQLGCVTINWRLLLNVEKHIQNLLNKL